MYAGICLILFVGLFILQFYLMRKAANLGNLMGYAQRVLNGGSAIPWTYVWMNLCRLGMIISFIVGIICFYKGW